jgi:UDP:flavonoid glycosyltransferase YjiC (YdhE family)
VAVLKAGLVALADIPARVIVTSGYQSWPADLPPLPPNARQAAYLPGPALAARSALMVNHGGHSSYLTGLAAGTPAVVVPTFTERESQARRLAALGAGRFVLPTVLPDGEKEVSVPALREAVLAVLADPTYAANARRIAESMRSYGGVATVANIVEEMATDKA